MLSDMEMVFVQSRCESHMNNILSPSYKMLPKKYVSVEREVLFFFLFSPLLLWKFNMTPEKVSSSF